MTVVTSRFGNVAVVVARGSTTGEALTITEGSDLTRSRTTGYPTALQPSWKAGGRRRHNHRGNSGRSRHDWAGEGDGGFGSGVLEGDEFPRFLILQHGAQQLIVQRVTRFKRAQMA